MTDTVVLLALSQLVCLGAVAYLHARIGSLQRQLAALRPSRDRRSEPAVVKRRGRAPELGPASQAPAADLVALASRMHDLGLDVPALARRMHRSEDEVRALLRRNGVQT